MILCIALGLGGGHLHLATGTILVIDDKLPGIVFGRLGDPTTIGLYNLLLLLANDLSVAQSRSTLPRARVASLGSRFVSIARLFQLVDVGFQVRVGADSLCGAVAILITSQIRLAVSNSVSIGTFCRAQ